MKRQAARGGEVMPAYSSGGDLYQFVDHRGERELQALARLAAK